MANLTLSVDDELLRRGRDYAARRGTSLNGLVRAYLEQMTRPTNDEVDAMMDRLRSSQGSSGGVRFNRDELYERGK